MNTFRTLTTTLSLAAAMNLLYGQDEAGIPDQNFSSDGIQTIDLSNAEGYDRIADALPMADGRILTIGTAEPVDAFQDLCVATFLPDGSLDQRVLFDFSPGLFIIEGVATAKAMVNGEEKYYVLCKREISGAQQLCVVRLGADLALDPQWAGDGSAIMYFDDVQTSLTCEPKDIAVQPDGKVVVAGAFNGLIALARFTTEGALDNTFSFNGKVTTDLADYTEEVANAVAITPTGNILVAGNISSTGIPALTGFVTRYTTDGSIDLAFGENGTRPISFGAGLDVIGLARVNAMLVQADGRIVVAGSGTDVDASDTDFGVARLTADGTFDGDFGSDGKVKVDFPPDAPFNSDYAQAITLDATGKLTVAGNIASAIGELGLARLHINGDLDDAFGNNGIVVTDQQTFSCSVRAVFVDEEQRIVVAGGLRVLGTDMNTDSYLQRFIGLNVGLPEQTPAAVSVSVFPNPMTGPVTLRYTLGGSAEMNITLYDAQGREIAEVMRGRQLAAGTHLQVLDLPGSIAPGSYVLVLSTTEGRTSVRVSK